MNEPKVVVVLTNNQSKIPDPHATKYYCDLLFTPRINIHNPVPVLMDAIKTAVDMVSV